MRSKSRRFGSKAISRLSERWPSYKIAPYEFIEFGMLGLNPKDGSSITWKFVQYYEDGMKEEFTGPVGSRYPAPVVTLKKIETSTK